MDQPLMNACIKWNYINKTAPYCARKKMVVKKFWPEHLPRTYGAFWMRSRSKQDSLFARRPGACLSLSASTLVNGYGDKAYKVARCSSFNLATVLAKTMCAQIMKWFWKKLSEKIGDFHSNKWTSFDESANESGNESENELGEWFGQNEWRMMNNN